MIPILYESSETAFMSNGIARLRDCISCEVTEERNGVYECDFEYPIDGVHFEDIVPGRIIAVTHDESGDVQPFDITSYSKAIDGIARFHAVHISYRQSFLTVVGTGINSLTDALNLLQNNSEPVNPFRYESDFNSTAFFAGADGTPKTVRQLLGGSEGSILDAYGGEYEWDKFTVILRRNRGEIRDFAVRYGINMTDYQDDSDYFGTFNSCVPFWNGEGGPIIGSRVSSDLASYNGADLCLPLDLTDKFENAPTIATLESAARSYMSSKQTNLPAQNIRVDFLRIQDFSGYEDFRYLLECNLCDTITVVFPRYGMSGSYKIVRTVYDVLEERYVEMELGALQTSLAEALGINVYNSHSSSSGGGASFPIYFDTKANWDAQSYLIGEEHAIYVYTDYMQDDGKNIAGIKIGDGNAYLIDNPFLDKIYYEHVNDLNVHITALERAFWNNKVTCDESQVNNEILILTKN